RHARTPPGGGRRTLKRPARGGGGGFARRNATRRSPPPYSQGRAAPVWHLVSPVDFYFSESAAANASFRFGAQTTGARRSRPARACPVGARGVNPMTTPTAPTGASGGAPGSYNILVGNGRNVLTGGNGRRNLLIAGNNGVAGSTLIGGDQDDILI